MSNYDTTTKSFWNKSLITVYMFNVADVNITQLIAKRNNFIACYFIFM